MPTCAACANRAELILRSQGAKEPRGCGTAQRPLSNAIRGSSFRISVRSRHSAISPSCSPPLNSPNTVGLGPSFSLNRWQYALLSNRESHRNQWFQLLAVDQHRLRIDQSNERARVRVGPVEGFGAACGANIAPGPSPISPSTIVANSAAGADPQILRIDKTASRLWMVRGVSGLSCFTPSSPSPRESGPESGTRVAPRAHKAAHHRPTRLT